MRLFARRGVRSGAQRALDAASHLCCSLARERDRNDLLGLLHGREQREIALDEQLGLAGAGRRLNDERLRGVERGLARRCVAHRRSPPHRRAARQRELLEDARQRCVRSGGILGSVDEDARIARSELVGEQLELPAPHLELDLRLQVRRSALAVPERLASGQNPE